MPGEGSLSGRRLERGEPEDVRPVSREHEVYRAVTHPTHPVEQHQRTSNPHPPDDRLSGPHAHQEAGAEQGE